MICYWVIIVESNTYSLFVIEYWNAPWKNIPIVKVFRTINLWLLSKKCMFIINIINHIKVLNLEHWSSSLPCFQFKENKMLSQLLLFFLLLFLQPYKNRCINIRIFMKSPNSLPAYTDVIEWDVTGNGIIRFRRCQKYKAAIILVINTLYRLRCLCLCIIELSNLYKLLILITR